MVEEGRTFVARREFPTIMPESPGKPSPNAWMKGKALLFDNRQRAAMNARKDVFAHSNGLPWALSAC
jgi:hypothetical protein